MTFCSLISSSLHPFNHTIGIRISGRTWDEKQKKLNTSRNVHTHAIKARETLKNNNNNKREADNQLLVLQIVAIDVDKTNAII